MSAEVAAEGSPNTPLTQRYYHVRSPAGEWSTEAYKLREMLTNSLGVEEYTVEFPEGGTTTYGPSEVRLREERLPEEHSPPGRSPARLDFAISQKEDEAPRSLDAELAPTSNEAAAPANKKKSDDDEVEGMGLLFVNGSVLVYSAIKLIAFRS